MEILAPSGIMNYIIALNIVFLVIACLFIFKSNNSLSAKLFAFLVSLLIPFLGSLFVILNYSLSKRLKSEHS